MDKSSYKGQVLILFALAIIVLFGFGALAIDIGHLYNVKNQLQVAADASSLAGASTLDGTQDPTQAAARDAARKIAAKNVADVAYVSVPPFGPSPGAAKGQLIPVALRPTQAEGDIVVGYWNGTTFTPATGGTVINAVQVTARRDEDGPDTPFLKPQNWFAKVFKLLGASYDFSSVSAIAIAAKGELPFIPIAVNEYWDEVPGKPGVAYGQVYPESFMRSINADAFGPTPPSPPTTARGGQIFAILGTEANSNDSSFNLNSFVDILLRNRFHDGRATDTPSAWWEVQQSDTTGSCSPSCDSNLSALPAGAKTGQVNNSKYDQSFDFLFTGIPDNVIPPGAVREIARPTPPYPGDNYNNTDTFNDPSNCPYATIPYFSGSGGNIVDVPKGPDKTRFYEKWPKGSRFMIMVYDGTHTTFPDPDQANVVTVVGYGIIEIDGYMSGNYRGDPSALGDKGNTAYGHAIPHGLSGIDPAVADVSDTYLIQPPLTPANASPASARKGTCAFTDILRQFQKSFPSVRLVGPGLRYGLAH